MQLAGAVAVVTGGGSGIGQAIAARFAREGAQVVVVDQFAERAQESVVQIAADGGTALAVTADVTQAAEIAHLVSETEQRFGPATILVNNAGGSWGDDLLTIDEETWDRNLAVVLKSVFLCAKACLPAMIARRQGVIVNIASVNGLMALGGEPYSAAKAGMISLTQNMAVKYGPHGVRVNAICPGTVRTPIWDARVARDPEVFDRLAAWYPLGRVGEPADIASAALFLASSESAWITGTTLTVDGGLLAGYWRMAQDLERGASS